jgi:truncated hemoglobin YjbI
MSLWDDAGGEEGVRRVLRALYDELFDDVMVGFLFAGKNKETLVEHQVWFTARFLGGPQDRYKGRPLPETHASLPLLPGHFDRRHHLLKETLAKQNVPEHVAVEWLRIDENLRTSVLKSGADARERARREP